MENYELKRIFNTKKFHSDLPLRRISWNLSLILSCCILDNCDGMYGSLR